MEKTEKRVTQYVAVILAEAIIQLLEEQRELHKPVLERKLALARHVTMAAATRPKHITGLYECSDNVLRIFNDSGIPPLKESDRHDNGRRKSQSCVVI